VSFYLVAMSCCYGSKLIVSTPAGSYDTVDLQKRLDERKGPATYGQIQAVMKLLSSGSQEVPMTPHIDNAQETHRKHVQERKRKRRKPRAAEMIEVKASSPETAPIDDISESVSVLKRLLLKLESQLREKMLKDQQSDK